MHIAGTSCDDTGHLGRSNADEDTLQVEPQEKKKTPKGRAKKRITYNRRFVNVTMTGGKRKVRIAISPSPPPIVTVADVAPDEPQPNLISDSLLAREGNRDGHEQLENSVMDSVSSGWL